MSFFAEGNSALGLPERFPSSAEILSSAKFFFL
jgi:hypothetical protein